MWSKFTQRTTASGFFQLRKTKFNLGLVGLPVSMEYGVGEEHFAEVCEVISQELLCQEVGVEFPYWSTFLAGNLLTLTASSQ